MRHVITATLLLAAIIHLLPIVGVLGPARLTQAYGLGPLDSNLEILLRHRAVLFGIVGAFMAYAAFVPSYQVAGFGIGLASAVSFLVIAHGVGAMNANVARVAAIDVVAVALLVAGGAALLVSRPG